MQNISEDIRASKQVTWSAHEEPMQNHTMFRPPACTAIWLTISLLLSPSGWCPYSIFYLAA